MKTQEEINAMKDALLRQRANIPERSLFGTNNHEIIDGQIRVLDGEFTDADEIFDYFGGDNTAEEYDESDDELATEVLRALDWLNGDVEDEELVDEDWLS